MDATKIKLENLSETIAEALKDKFSITNRDSSFFEPTSYATERQIADVIHPLFQAWLKAKMESVKPI